MDPADVLAIIALIIALCGVAISTSAIVVLIRRVNEVHVLVNSDMTVALQDALTAKRLLRHNLASTLLLKESQGLEVTQEELGALITVDAEINDRMNTLSARVKTQAKVIVAEDSVKNGVVLQSNTTTNATNQKGIVMSDMEKAVAGGAEHMAAQKAHVDEVAAREAARRAELSDNQRKGVNSEDLHSVGFASSTEMTSPGGPWHGLPPEAATDPNSADWAENCRWACVQGSFFACTFDGSTNVGDHAENVRGYGIPTDDGQAYMRTISTLPEDQKVQKCIEVGNDIVYNGQFVSYTK